MADDKQQRATMEPPREASVGDRSTTKPKVDENSDDVRSKRAAVSKWLKNIKNDKLRWEDDFKRMRLNMRFVTGKQWDGQRKMEDDRYTNNVTLRMVNQKVASLYARNPQVDVVRREKLDFAVWDGDMQSLMMSMQSAAMMTGMGGIANPMDMMVLQDYQQGMMRKKLAKKIADTLRLTYQYQIDCCRPEFKEQMKQLVCRVIVCGVGYCRPIFIRENQDEGAYKTTDVPHSILDRAKRAKQILQRLEEKEIQEDDPQVQTLKSLFLSMGVSTQVGDEALMEERVEFDFPPATSIIPSAKCRSLMEFVSAPHVSQEFVIGLDEANAFFGTEIKVGSGEGEAKEYTPTGDEIAKRGIPAGEEPAKEKMVCLYEIFDYKTKTHCIVCDGWKDYVVEPEPLLPAITGFWPLFALVFNRIEVEEGSEASIYPPSDVDLLRHPQKEWNRTRDALRGQRNANAPKYLARKGMLTEEDKNALRDAEPNQVIELAGVPMDVALDKAVMVMQVAKIDPAVYDTRPLSEDIQYGVGTQEANLGPAQPNVTATTSTIAEQSRITVSSSNVDDLDGYLTRVIRATGEIILKEFSQQTVMQIVGPGGVWSEQNRASYVNELEMKVLAASSGRPNKAVETANFERIAPTLLQAGANPIAVIREGIRRMDDRLDYTEFYPVALPPMLPPGQSQGSPEAGGGAPPSKPSQGPAAPEQPLQELPSQAPVPLAAA